MRPEIVTQLPAIRALCVQHRIRGLWLFGSAAVEGGKHFDPARSDYDFVVDFMDDDLGPWLKKYFDFKDAMEALLGRSVDLMMLGALNPSHSRMSPYLRTSVDRSKVPLYAAA